MKRKWTAVREGIGQAAARQGEPSFLYQLAIYGVLFGISLLIPRATVYGGLSPFGISIAACAQGPAALIASLGAAVGYLLPSDVVLPLRYIAALIAVAGFNWAFGGVSRVTKSPLYSPLLAFSATLLTGLAINSLNGFQWSVLVSELCESVLSGGFAYFFRNTLETLKTNDGPRSFTLHQQASLIVCAAVVLMAIGTVTFGGVSVGRILTVTVILLAAKAGGQQAGTLVGVVLGAATALCMPSYAHLAASFAFGGLIAGLFSRFGRLASAVLFVLVNTLVVFSMGESEAVVISVYETAAAALIFLILPPSVERGVNALFSRAESLPAIEGLQRSVDMRLTYAANTMEEIAQTVDTVSKKLAAMNAPQLKEVYAQVCEGLCEGCRRREICWKNEFTDTMAAFRHMGDTLKKNGVVTHNEVDERFAIHCHHLEDVLITMNQGYSRFVLKEHAYRRLNDIRSIVADQFQGMSSLLLELSEDFQELDRTDVQAAKRIERVCERYKMPLVQVVCLIGRRNRVTVELLIEGENVPEENSQWHKEICDASGCQLTLSTVSKSGNLTKIRLTETPRLSVRFAAAQLNCQKEKLCGDAYEQFYDHEGRCCVVLSDGMGTGGRAAVDGAMTAALAGRMLQAGFRFESILRIINSALIVKSGDESLSTLDTVQIDLFSGAVRGLKAGAAPSFLYDRGRLTKIAASSLPIGILQEVDAHPYEEHLEKGDWLILISDGVAEGDSEWLEELICRRIEQDVDENVLANEIVFYARERQPQEHGDDTTALVLRVC